MRLSIISMSCLLLACGGEEISLQPFDFEPGCYQDPPAAEPSNDPDAIQQLHTAHRQLMEFRISFAAQAAELLSKPVREDPGASEWHVENDRAVIDGELIAQGEEWSVVEMVVYTKIEINGRQVSYQATIETTPVRTTYDFGGGSFLDIRPHLFQYEEVIRGCDPEKEISFEVVPVPTEDGAERLESRCWPFPELGDDLDAEVSAEFEASLRLQCLQLIERNLLP